MTEAEALMIWTANKGQGSFHELKQAIKQISHAGNTEEPILWAVINGLNNLGYIQRAPKNDGWVASGQTMVILPGRDGLALLTGCFNRQHITEIGIDYGFWPTYVPASLDPLVARFLPKTMYVETSAIESYVEYQQETGCRYLDVESALMRLSQSEDLQLAGPVAPPRYDTGNLELFELKNLSYAACSVGTENGLYKQRVNGRLMYWIRTNGAWYPTDRGTGPWLWRSISDEVHEDRRLVWYREKTQSIYINRKIALPSELERLLTLCSGLLPMEDPKARRYDNVTSALSASIFDYLKLDSKKGS